MGSEIRAVWGTPARSGAGGASPPKAWMARSTTPLRSSPTSTLGAAHRRCNINDKIQLRCKPDHQDHHETVLQSGARLVEAPGHKSIVHSKLEGAPGSPNSDGEVAYRRVGADLKASTVEKCALLRIHRPIVISVY
jgi:hypothetical protein